MQTGLSAVIIDSGVRENPVRLPFQVVVRYVNAGGNKKFVRPLSQVLVEGVEAGGRKDFIGQGMVFIIQEEHGVEGANS